MGMLKQTVRPELLNRIDETIMFEPLNKQQITEVVRLQVNGVIRMLAEQGINLTLNDHAIEQLANMGFDPEYGARPVKRAIQQHLLNDLSRKILAGTVDSTKPIVIDAIE